MISSHTLYRLSLERLYLTQNRIYESWKKKQKSSVKKDEDKLKDLLVRLEAKKYFEYIWKQEEKFDWLTIKPYDFEDLLKKYQRLESEGKVREDFSEEENKKIEVMVKFLSKPYNRRLFTGYKKLLNNSPKTILMHISDGFSGYQKDKDKIKNLFEKTPKKLVKDLFSSGDFAGFTMKQK